MTQRSPSEESHAFVPALGVGWLTRFYDPLIRLTLRETVVKQCLIDRARIVPGMEVLDLGCGTGTLAVMIKRSCPEARVRGLDVDPQILAIAREKIASAGVEIALQQGSAANPPFAPASFDRVLTSLVLHHLKTADKVSALAGTRRLLRADGELHVADFGPPQNALMWLMSQGVRWLDGSGRTEDNLKGRLPTLIHEAGFVDVEETMAMMTPFGTLRLLRASIPG